MQMCFLQGDYTVYPAGWLHLITILHVGGYEQNMWLRLMASIDRMGEWVNYTSLTLTLAPKTIPNWP